MVSVRAGGAYAAAWRRRCTSRDARAHAEHATLDQLLEHAVDREAAERTIKELDALRSSLEKQLE